MHRRREGWYWPKEGDGSHYFRDTVSLCQEWYIPLSNRKLTSKYIARMKGRVCQVCEELSKHGL